MTKSGKCSERIERQKGLIEKTLAEKPMTIAALAGVLSLSSDTVRNRINEMIAERRPVRVADWVVLETTMVRVWGYGTERNEPRPVRVRVEGTKRSSGETGRKHRTEAVPPVRFRREGMDEWLFRIRELG